MHRAIPRGQHHRKPEPHEGPWPRIVVASVIGAFAIVAVMALPVLMPKPAAPTATPEKRPDAWDSTGGGAQAGLESISRGTHAASMTRLSPDPVAAVRDVSARYTATRLAEIKEEIAKIDANDWRTQADIDRRQALVEEQRRLIRY